MKRRKICKLLAGTAAASALSAAAVPAGAAVPPGVAGSSEETAAGSGFGAITEDYAKFCATPAAERVFYSYDGKQMVKEKLDEETWLPTGWSYPQKSSFPAGFWDAVPLDSPFPNLAGEGPYKPDWDSLLRYETPEWYRDAKFGIWAHWGPQCVPEDDGWYARRMYIQAHQTPAPGVIDAYKLVLLVAGIR